MDMKKGYLLADDDWKYDAVPEIMDGKNIADFIDPDIAAKLDALEREQEQLEEEEAGAMDSDESDLDETDRAILDAIREKKKLLKNASRLQNGKNYANMPRKHRDLEVGDVVDHLEGVGVDSSGIASRGRKRTRADAGRAADEEAEDAGADGMDVEGAEGDEGNKKQKRSRSRSVVKKSANEEGLKDDEQKKKTLAMLRKVQKGVKGFGKYRKAGEADRSTGPKKEKWALAGKSNGFKSNSR